MGDVRPDPNPEPARAASDPNASPGVAISLRLLGVPVRLHFTFLLLLVFLIAIGVGGSQSSLLTAVYFTALFASVLLHELGHVAVSRRFGIRTLEIVIFPIGGIARLERNPKPAEEFWIALAGPVVNILIAAGIFGYLFYTGAISTWSDLVRASDSDVVRSIALGNLVIAAFNMLPAFPMDGGRVVRAFIARHKPEDEATRSAAQAGRYLAIAMGLYGLVAGNYMLLFVALFVYLGATQESAAALGRALTQGVPVRAAMITDFRTLSHGDTLQAAADLLLATSQQDFPVVLGEQVIGLLSRNALLRGISRQGGASYVAGAMERTFLTVSPEADLGEAMPLLSRTGSCALVMEGERLLGLLTRENFAEYLMLRRYGLPARPE
ncbi:MAG: CBS domain-containing protein [Acidobacteria bacterium]|nr:CBS domain-containing protein [Acidobacteriota bacterium]